MLFKYDLYPAEMLKAIIDAESRAENALEGIKRMMTALIINDLRDVPPTFKELAESMYVRAMQRSNTCRANALKRDYSQANARQNTEKPEDVEEQGEEEKRVQDAPKPKKVAIDIAGYVKVTEKEYDSLRDRFGKDLPEMVEILSAYKESTGKKYKSDAGALRGWVRRSFEERKAKAGAKSFKAMERERDASVVGSMLTDEQRRAYGL
jgi:hypothetical protein